MIADVGHIALRVPDVDACVAHAQDVLGMREVERIDGESRLTCDAARTRLRYIPGPEPALDHVGLIAESEAGLQALSERLDRAGVDFVAAEDAPGASGIRFSGPDGHGFCVYAEPVRDQPAWYPTSGLRPTRFGHVTLTAPDIAVTEGFLVDVLGFRVSDRIVPGIGTWMRCSTEHHVLAVLAGPKPGLHHYAFDVEDFSGLGRLGDLLAGQGRRLIFGPGRHGPGNNLFTYHLDPAGICIEVCADMQKIFDDDTHVPGEWPATPETENLWGPHAPPGFDDLCAPNVAQGPSG